MITKQPYTPPRMECLEVCVELGFAQSLTTTFPGAEDDEWEDTYLR